MQTKELRHTQLCQQQEENNENQKQDWTLGSGYKYGWEEKESIIIQSFKRMYYEGMLWYNC